MMGRYNDGSVTELRRSLSLRHLILYGVVIIQPTAPMAIYGVVQQETRGFAVVALAIAMVAMLFTAVSYGRMAAVYPSAGSAFTYAGKELHPAAGFLTGWSLILDYVINPTICVIWSSKAAMNIIPDVPFAVWAFGFACLFTFINLRAIEMSARWNTIVASILGAVVLLVFGAGIRYLSGVAGVDLSAPIYTPAFDFSAVATGASVAVLTFIGFDAISTLAEEVENPARNIMRATVGTCLLIGLLSIGEVYLAQLVWPEYATIPDIDTAYVHIAGRMGGGALFHVVNSALLLATVGSGVGAQLAASRLLYGMSRDGYLPRMFAQLDAVRQIPRTNVLLTGAVALCGALVLSFQLGAELLNFGAFIGFLAVNASAMHRAFAEGRRWRMIAPALGFVVCLYVWLNLRHTALLTGGAWLVLGALYYGARVRSLRVDAAP